MYGGHLNKSDVAVGATTTITRHHAVEVAGANSSHGYHLQKLKQLSTQHRTGQTKFSK